MKKQEFIYTYAYRGGERALCHLEMRALFGVDSSSYLIKSTTEVEVSRSPFVKERIDVIYEGNSVEDIVEQVKEIHLGDTTFKVICLKINDLEDQNQIDYQGKRAIEREVGWVIDGEADVREPDVIFGMTTLGGKWYFGNYHKNQAVWLQQLKKPREYSTALSTKVARAVANIAVPNLKDVQAIDPCCGIGTVIVEALSMGINIVGRDMNPLAASGARENVAYFGFETDIRQGKIEELVGHYDVAIIDMPYNLATHATAEEQFSIIQHARRIADRVIIVTIETMDEIIEEVGFTITDRCETKKGTFSRQILVCQ